MSEKELVERLRQRIANRDYEALFARGGCYYFALFLREKFPGSKIHGIPDLSHVWCHKPTLNGGIGIDIRGPYPDEFLAELASKGETKAWCEFEDHVVRKKMKEKNYPPPELEKEFREVAEHIFATHQRFECFKEFGAK